MDVSSQDRPFLEYWDHLWQLEIRRKAGEFEGQGMVMVLKFMQDITYNEFLKHAKRTTALVEIARFYDNKFETESDVANLICALSKNYYHQEAFVYAVYFAAWVKNEVGESKRAFKQYDR